MIRTIIFFTVFWISFIISLVFLIPVLILKLSGFREVKKRYVKIITSEWSKMVLYLFSVKVNHNLKSNFPSSGYVIVSNHQGSFDIPVILSVLPVSPAFIAKIELKKMPLINFWMMALECLFIDRSDSTGSRKKIMKRLKDQNSNPLLIFPEGTRSRSSRLLSFRRGGLKMVFDSGTNVIPLRISGTYKIYEENGRIRPGEVQIEVKPLIQTKKYEKDEFGNFINDIRMALSADQ
jgi:1-acyl-sn-glycerol-3-phosphate acyltransferase